MDNEILETVTEWDTVPFDGGYTGLRALADEGFSGGIQTGTTWGFMLNGKLVGVVDGSIDAFAEAEATAYVAPDPALPLLFAMRCQGGERRGRYYTNDTPLRDVDETLTSGKFTGYVELSENVLSGDYYVVYYGGKAMSVAFVGNSRTLLTDEEAFERADDEVGIYEVYNVDVDIVDVPAPDSGSDPSDEARSTADSVPSAEPAPDDGDGVSDGSAIADRTEGTEPNTTSADPESSDETDGPDGRSTRDASDGGNSGGTNVEVEPAAARSDGTDRTAVDATGTDTSEANRGDGATQAAASTTGEEAQPTDQPTGDDADVFRNEAKWRETRSIPSLDPSESGAAQAKQVQKPERSRARRQNDRSASTRRESTSESSTRPPEETQATESRESKPRNAAERKLRRAEKLYKQVKQRAKRFEAERDSAREERDEAQKTVQRLRSEIESLRDELEAATQQSAASDQQTQTTARRTMSPEEALSGTNLFVRYDSKGDVTLEKIQSGNGDRSDLVDNLRLEKHTAFDTEQRYIDGKPYEAFLTETIEYGFTRWVVEELLFEIQDTGNESGLRGLYEAIPLIDRAEFRGTVELEPADGDEEPLETTFDVVLRDRMGGPLIVADFNDSREPARSGMVESLVRSGSDLTALHDDFGGAMAVTSSFFDPSALESAGDATGGGLLSRNKGKSHVKVGRKRGFHLCLVETREGDYHMSVPEL
ncbi:MAG: DUF7527 domain-containing protein [Halobacteriota archaeon]